MKYWKHDMHVHFVSGNLKRKDRVVMNIIQCTAFVNYVTKLHVP